MAAVVVVVVEVVEVVVEVVVAFRVAGKGFKDDVAVDLTKRRGGGCEGSQHRAVNGGGAVRPSQCIGMVPQNFVRICARSGDAVAENLIAAVQDVRTIHGNEDGRACRCDDVDAVELVECQTGAVDVGAVKAEDVERLVDAGQIELSEDDRTRSVGYQSAPENRSAL